jgi:glyoxylase-like metal-dependent hydrolase (beta-lactamase superfamily II)
MHRMATVWGPRFSTELETRRVALAAELRSGRRADGSIPTPEELRQDQSDVDEYAKFTDESLKLRRVFPTMTFTDTLEFLHGGREFRFMSVTGDTDGTTVLYLPREKVLITGDAVSYPVPYLNANLPAHARSLKMLASLNATVIVPGHGPAFHDNAFLDLERQLIESVLDGVAKARANGTQTLEEMQRIVTVDDLREKFTHGDADLDARFRSRVSGLVTFAMAK